MRWLAIVTTALVLPLALQLAPLQSARAELPAQAESWLEKMLTAQAEASYEGEMVYTHGSVMSTLGVVHRVTPNGIEERLFALDGAPREVVRSAERLACQVQKGERMEMSLNSAGPAKPRLMERLGEIGDYYRVELKGRQRIARRETQRIDLMPVGAYRYGHRLWLDIETGLPLKTQLVRADHRVLEQVMFTEIHFLDPAVEAADLGGDTSPDESPLAAGDADFGESSHSSDWLVERLPRGFRLSGNHMLDNDSGPVEHLIYSDGLATVSVFIEDLGDTPGFTGISQQGTLTVYGRTHASHQVTVVGEVPELTLRDIGDSLRKVDTGSRPGH